MSLTGFLDNFSLAEILQIIDSGYKSGRLVIKPSPEKQEQEFAGSYYLWFEQGKLVSVTNNFSNTYLLSFVEQQGLINHPKLQERIRQLCSTIEPVGLCLYKHGSLTKQQLQLILQTQLEEIYKLFEISFGWFKFEDISDQDKMPWSEMTGESIEARQLALNGLRKLTNWKHLESVIPESNSILEQLVTQHNLKLEPLEFKLWKFADGETSLQQFAKAFNQPIVTIQRAAYGLIVADLIEALPVFDISVQSSLSTNKNQILPEPKLATVGTQSVNTQPKVNNSLVSNLLRFLGNF
ncbi:hypothetical protein Sta7437_2543 [Stanieria cyanosphaera PCC 7437]|uniref:PatA-like N-terminal domain-containing protein n=1 Tax=Stanieria cyanosphaera (strain ATCC 29371 / PCC 7437) TaxID=111780 RepID=K9XVH6_STAC7|nr:DUF4388 domain-containing protein [Stanieria cyanosphaera]AFZ36076.1 hypothetical protein Sta7437_2543 [Stanieria cyanosphaera PCC 7437]